MINVTKPDYRTIKALNQSMVKIFAEDPIKFYEQFKLGKLPAYKNSTAIAIGDLVDFYVLECKGNREEFDLRIDEKFSFFSEKKSTSQAIVLADELFKITKDSAIDGEITQSFAERFTRACLKVQKLGKYLNKSEDQILSDFNKKGLDYFESLMANIGKTVIDDFTVRKAISIGETLMTDSFTSHLFNKCETKVQVEWTFKGENGEIKCKSEIDFLKIDRTNKKIFLYDLKTTYDNEGFHIGYLKNKYYIQSAFYYHAAKSMFPDYEIVPMAFVVADTSKNERRPLIYQTTMLDLEKAMDGFSLCGYNYRGMNDLMEDILWAEKYNIWNVSREAYERKGVIDLGFVY